MQMIQTRRLLLLAASWMVAVPARALHRKAHKKARIPAPAASSAQGDNGTQDADSNASPANTLLGPLDTVARWAIVVDYNTGATLLDKNADEEMTPSSLTKLMTAYLVFSALKAGRLALGQQLPVSERAWRMQGSKMFVALGSTVSVEDLIRGMIIQSGNDACIVLAEGVAGSEEAFVVQMNQMARQLGLTHSVFQNCDGWPLPGHHMSVRDIATLATRLIRDFPQYYHYFDEKSFTYNNIHQDNRNPLVDAGTADGLKTGHTEDGGYGLCASAERGGRRVILVLNGMGTNKQRSTEGERILDWAFANFEDAQMVKKGQVIDRAQVWLGTVPDVPLVAARDLVLTMPVNWRDHARIEANFASPLNAPLQAGTKVGSVNFTFPGFNMLPQQVDLLVGESIPEQGVLDRAMTVLRLRLGRKS